MWFRRVRMNTFEVGPTRAFIDGRNQAFPLSNIGNDGTVNQSGVGLFAYRLLDAVMS